MRHFIFTAVMLVLISLPLVFFNAKQKISEKENRALAEKPPLIKENHINESIFKEYDDYFQDHLGFRSQLIQLDASNPLKLKPASNIRRAVEGRNGWYFYTNPLDGNNLMDFYKRNLLTPEQLEQFAERIARTYEWCKEQGIFCIFIIGPNKHSVYEEHYPFERPEGITRADQITHIFEELDIPYVFSRDFLISKKSEYDYPFYYETDTHWNSQGAYLTFTILKDKIEALFPDTTFPQISYEASVYESNTYGDLLPMLNLKNGKSTQVSLLPKGGRSTDFYTYIKNDSRNGIHTKGCDERLPRALFFRDSFFIALEPFVSPLFSEAEYKWSHFNDSDKAHVLEYKPDIIIFESVERSSLTIVN